LHQERVAMGTPADLPELRRDALLRFVAEPARDQARPRQWAPGRRISGAWRALAVLLRRRGVRRVLTRQCRLKYCTTRSCFSAALRVLKVPRFLRLPVLGWRFRE